MAPLHSDTTSSAPYSLLRSVLTFLYDVARPVFFHLIVPNMRKNVFSTSSFGLSGFGQQRWGWKRKIRSRDADQTKYFISLIRAIITSSLAVIYGQILKLFKAGDRPEIRPNIRVVFCCFIWRWTSLLPRRKVLWRSVVNRVGRHLGKTKHTILYSV